MFIKINLNILLYKYDYDIKYKFIDIYFAIVGAGKMLNYVLMYNKGPFNYKELVRISQYINIHVYLIL